MDGQKKLIYQEVNIIVNNKYAAFLLKKIIFKVEFKFNSIFVNL